MSDSKFIKVGIKTKGDPCIKQYGDYSLISNMLIGDGFHWETVIEAKLPGKIIPCADFEEGNSNNNSNVTLINILPIEKYLECVVGSEMNPTAPLEFLKAHAVISRSWVMGKVLDIHPKGNKGRSDDQHSLIGWEDTGSHQKFNVCSDDHCQRYQGIQAISPKAKRAIEETAGEILVDSDGNILDARFSKCCGGVTEIFSTCWQDSEMKGLASIRDPFCNLSDLSASSRRVLLSSILKSYDLATENYGFEWGVKVTKEEIKTRLEERFGRNVGKVERIEPLLRGPSGRIKLLRIHGSDSCLDIGKELWIRRLLSPTHLYSSAFDIEDQGDILRLSGHGWGHGVGLCQIGAARMAHEGYNYREILSFYYQGSGIEILP